MATHHHGKAERGFVPVKNPDNSSNWLLANIAKRLYGPERIRESAHGRFVEEDFTPLELATIRTESKRSGLENIDPNDIKLVRREMELAAKAELERQQKSRQTKVQYLHNNTQVEIVKLAANNGVTISTEKNFIDLNVEGLLIGELKIKPEKGDFEHAYGHLVLASRNLSVKKFVVAVNKKPGKTIVKWFTEEGIALVTKIGNQFTFENDVPGFELLHQALGM